MPPEPPVALPNVRQAAPLFRVADMAASLAFYVDGLGFEVTNRWPEAGALRWCWLQLGGAALMLQAGAPTPGEGVTLYFICADAPAIWREVVARGVAARRPFVGNGMWVTELADPDGYRLAFESPTDAAEESELPD
ncbi:MAG: VOC family protein [Phenylobacterium sp.]